MRTNSAICSSTSTVTEARPATSVAGGWSRVVAFGDSITRGYAVPPGAGWVEQLAVALAARDGAVVNAGGNGNTSAEGLQRLDTDVLAHLPGLVLVEFGGNDTVHDARAVSVDAFERNLRAIHAAVTNRGGTVVFLTFPPVINEWHSTRADAYYAPWGGLDACVEEYRQRTREVAQQLGCPLFDLDQFLRRLMTENGRALYIHTDGVHLTPEANTRVAEAILQFLTDGESLHLLRTEKVALAGLDDLAKITFVSRLDQREDYALIRPPSTTAGAPKARAGVWVVNLHGHGSTGDQLFTRPDIRDNWLPQLLEANLGIVTPNYRGNSWMCPEAVADLHALLTHLRVTYAATTFIFISGSMGGTSNLIYAALHPEDVAACVAFCPATDLPSYLAFCRTGQSQRPILGEIGDAIASAYHEDAGGIARHSALQNADQLTMPIRIVHGDNDPLIPIAQARRLRLTLGDRGERFVYEEIPGGGHDAPLAREIFAAALAWARRQLPG